MTAVRMTNLAGRAALDLEGRAIDVADRSNGRFSSDPMLLLADWERFSEWARAQSLRGDETVIDPDAIGPCVPAPRSVFGIGLNYKDHAAEAKLDIPKSPMVFTKFPSCLAGPHADIPLTSDRVDWEVELVVVIGRGGSDIPEERAFDHVAGYTAGQDISDRRQQFADKPPQFSLGKSARAFGPIGPAIVTLDGFADPNDIALNCSIDGEMVQQSRTSELIFPVPQLVSFISRWCELAPGDLIFTGTPAGVGSVRDPRRYLAPGNLLETEVEGIGRLRNRCISRTAQH